MCMYLYICECVIFFIIVSLKCKGISYDIKLLLSVFKSRFAHHQTARTLFKQDIIYTIFNVN